MKNKFNVLIIALFALIFGVNSVDAAKLDWAKDVTKNGNTTTVGVNLILDEGETVTEAKFACSTDNANVKCEIKKNEKYESPTFVFESGYAKTLSDASFNKGENHLVNLILTNESDKTVDVKVSLDGSSFETNENRKTLTVTVDKRRSSNAKAASVKFSQGTMVPEFNPDVESYTVYNIQDTINSVIGNHECQDANTCDFSWSGGKSISNVNKIFLNMGENKVTLELTSEDGQNKKTYNFTIIRGSTGYNSSKLASLTIGDYILTPAFSKDVLEYSINVPNKITTLANIFKFTPEDEKANVTTDKYDNLAVGENIIKITVDSANADETTTYTVKVNRLTLENIDVTNYKDSVVTYVDGEGVKYELNEEEFKLQYPDDYLKIIDGTYKFNEDGERETEQKEEVKEEVKEKPKKKDNKVILIVVLVIIGLIIIGISGFLIFKKKPNGKDKNGKGKIDKDNKSEDSESNNEEEIDETGIEEKAIEDEKERENNEDDTVDIDEALSDLMSTKQYNLEDFTKKEEE